MCLIFLQGKPITCITWGHNDKRLFASAGCHVHTIWFHKRVASLQYLCRRVIQHHLTDESKPQKLPLPTKLCNSIANLFSPTIKVTFVLLQSVHSKCLFV
eukprot:GHVU01007470.1.p2 GENE.GHVU01007470.1~~GHVU01007470.1.p2  ORF type:complete len:100 (-),score=1.85 GHVU01007470.1:314-613(-)